MCDNMSKQSALMLFNSVPRLLKQTVQVIHIATFCAFYSCFDASVILVIQGVLSRDWREVMKIVFGGGENENGSARMRCNAQEKWNSPKVKQAKEMSSKCHLNMIWPFGFFHHIKLCASSVAWIWVKMLHRPREKVDQDLFWNKTWAFR